MEVVGSKLVTIVDGHDIQHSNIAELQDGTPITIENLKVHILTKGYYFDLEERIALKNFSMEVE